MNNYNYGNSAIGALVGMGTAYIVVFIAIVIFAIVCMWRIFEKAGEPGWKSLIPIYNAIVYFRICWSGKVLLYMILGGIVCAVLGGIGMANNSAGLAGIAGFLMVIYYVALAVVGIIAMIKLAKRFGKGGGFAVGLILLNFIFLAILAFGDCDYDRDRA